MLHPLSAKAFLENRSGRVSWLVSLAALQSCSLQSTLGQFDYQTIRLIDYLTNLQLRDSAGLDCISPASPRPLGWTRLQHPGHKHLDRNAIQLWAEYSIAGIT